MKMKYTEEVKESIKKCAEQIVREDMPASAAYKLMCKAHVDVADMISFTAYTRVINRVINIVIDALIS